MKLLFFLLAFFFVLGLEAAVPVALLGDWAIITPSDEAAWLSVRESNGTPRVRIMWAVGGVREPARVEVEREVLSALIRRRRTKQDGGERINEQSIAVSASGDRLRGELLQTMDGQVRKEPFSGLRLPVMPSRPDLDKVRFGGRIRLFNGRDLAGWKTWRPEKRNGWSVRDGVLVNETPKTDFSAYGDHANLRTEREFEDFRLHIEFRVPPGGNSGIYLRGLYEVQVLDRDSRMQGINGAGSVFGRVEASENAGKPGGEWNTYDITLVDRHVTVVLNGRKVIDNQPVEGPTGGALFADVMRPGPIYLQGDHTSVAYRNIWLEPRLAR